MATHIHPFSTILAHFRRVLLHVLCYGWMVDYDDGESPGVMYIHNTPKRIPTFMAIAWLSLGNNVLCGFSL